MPVSARGSTDRGAALRRRLGARPGGLVTALTLASLPVVLGCEIEEITVVDVEDVVIAEVYVNMAADPLDNEILGFLHRTVGTGSGSVADLAAARVTVTRSDGYSIDLANAPVPDCVEQLPEGGEAACFTDEAGLAATLGPGDDLALTISFEDGARLDGATRVPGPFELLTVGERCRIEPNTLLPLEWSRSEGAWAYVNETAISGLPDALESEGIVVEDDPLYLLGLSISDTDTTTIFPSEFGVFDRFDLDQDLAVRLQRGIPLGSFAEVTITAVDRNYVNWSRGGNFNPSGQVRVASLRGRGTGVFASTVGRRVTVGTTSDTADVLRPCPTVP